MGDWKIRRIKTFSTFVLALATLLSLTSARAAETQPVIIKFRSTPGIFDKSSVAASAKLEERSRLENDLIRLMRTGAPARLDFRRVFNGVAVDVTAEAIKAIRALPYVEAVYPDVKVHAVLLDSVPLIRANQVWSQQGVTGLGVRVAILDTGIGYTHPDLGGCLGPACKVVGGYDFINNDNNPRDDHGHGTHVAGIVAANGVVKGVAPDARLLAYKVLDASGSGPSSTVIAGIDDAVDPDGNPATNDGARVINLSLSGFGDPDDPMSQAVDNAAALGITVVVAAGNSGPGEQSIGSPGTARRAITVGATDKFDNPASFSSRGPVIWNNGAILKPDIVAPGVAICSTRWASSWAGAECIDSVHVALSGTSMATPHVAGVAALLLQKNPSWTPANVKAALRSTALNLTQPKTMQGYGRVRALRAIQLDHAPPIASLITSGTLTSVVDIKGTATSPTLQSYTLSIGKGLDPTTWTPLASSNQPVTNGVLAADFDPLARPDDIYTLRLVVTDTTNLSSEDRTFIQVDNVKVTTPLGIDSYRLGAQIDVQGSVFGGTQFDRYTIEYGEGYSPTEWRTTGVTLANGGNTPVLDGYLGTWNTAGLVSPGIYTLRVLVTNSWGISVETVNAIYLDPLLKAGWPIRLPYDFAPDDAGLQLKTYGDVYTFAAPSRARTTTIRSERGSSTTVLTSSAEFAEVAASYYHSGLLAPVVSDLDRDGSGEIVVLQGGVPPKLRVYGGDGVLQWLAPLGTGGVAGGNLGLPAIGDIDNDGRQEIMTCVPNFSIFPYTSTLYAFHSDGTNVAGFPVAITMDFHPSVILADVDIDGFKDIVIQGNGGDPRKLTVVGHLGNVISEWTLPVLRWGATIQSTPAVGNFDDDLQLEIVVAEPSEFAGYDFSTNTWNNTGVIHIYNLGGTEASGWPIYTQGITFSSPIVADLNGDGKEDVVVGHQYANSTGHDPTLGGIDAFDRFGNSLAGWPQLVGEQFLSTPAVGDLNKDGVPEIAISDLSQRTWVLRANGQVASGWPQGTAWANYHSTAIVDVNGDGSLDVLATAANGYSGGGVYAWTHLGNTIPSFPLYTDVDAQAGPTVADIDNDGKVEVVASSTDDFDFTKNSWKARGSLYTWDLTGAYRDIAAPWPHFHRDSTHAGRFEIIAGSLAYTLSPTALAFGNQALNVVSSVKAITVLNTGGAALPITAIAIVGAHPTQFTQINNCGSSVPAGASCTVNVTFRPTTGGSKAAKVRVTAGGGAASKKVSVSGTGARSARPLFSLSPSTLAFGNRPRNTTSNAKSVKISNIGSVALAHQFNIHCRVPSQPIRPDEQLSDSGSRGWQLHRQRRFQANFDWRQIGNFESYAWRWSRGEICLP